jgi:hypothetical protein
MVVITESRRIKTAPERIVPASSVREVLSNSEVVESI